MTSQFFNPPVFRQATQVFPRQPCLVQCLFPTYSAKTNRTEMLMRLKTTTINMTKRAGLRKTINPGGQGFKNQFEIIMNILRAKSNTRCMYQ